MKKLFYGLTALLLLLDVNAAQAQTPDWNGLIRPFLDSMRIVPFNDVDKTICLVSVFPASRAVDAQFDDYETEGLFTFHASDNPKMPFFTTQPIALYHGLRLGVKHSIYRGTEYTNIDLEKKYRFTSKAEENAAGEKMIRQTLELKTFLNQEPRGGIIEAEFWSETENKALEIGRPVYRHALYYTGERAPNHATHLAKDAEGVYSPIDFEEGSDRTFPSFKGGRMGLFVFQIKYTKYTPEMLEKETPTHVLVNATITTKGKIKNISFMNSLDPAFQKEALRLVKKTSGKWIPATKNGAPIEDTTTFTLQFDPQFAPSW